MTADMYCKLTAIEAANYDDLRLTPCSDAHPPMATVVPRPRGPGPYKLAAIFLAVVSAGLLICITVMAAHNKKVPQAPPAEEGQFQKQIQEVSVPTLTAAVAKLQMELAKLQEERDQLLVRLHTKSKPTEALGVTRPAMAEDVPKGSVAAPTVCPWGWHLFNDSCYYICEDEEDWEGSQSICQSMGAHLAIITTVEEQSFLWESLPIAHWNAYWIGLTDGHTEDDWKWVDGTRLENSFWEDGEPNNHINEDCAYMVKTENLERVMTKSWYDSICTLSWKYICEKEMRAAKAPAPLH